MYNIEIVINGQSSSTTPFSFFPQKKTNKTKTTTPCHINCIVEIIQLHILRIIKPLYTI